MPGWQPFESKDQLREKLERKGLIFAACDPVPPKDGIVHTGPALFRSTARPGLLCLSHVATMVTTKGIRPALFQLRTALPSVSHLFFLWSRVGSCRQRGLEFFFLGPGFLLEFFFLGHGFFFLALLDPLSALFLFPYDKYRFH